MKYKFVSDYVPAEIAMSVKEDKKNREVIGIIDDDVDDSKNAIEEYNRKYKRIWLLHIYPCQKKWYKNVRCSIFSSLYITDALGCIIFTFAC